MPYSLSELADDVRSLLNAAPVSDCSEEICGVLIKALTDEEFISLHLPEREADENPREILYEDPELGFCICGHVYSGEAIGQPHDHGPSWAIYGQAGGTTEMTDWEIVEPGIGDSPSLVRPRKTYAMNPGDARFYDVGDVHSPKRTAPTRLIRIEGKNLDNVTRSNIAASAD
jgi:predicted metal-dependent enzyme (double-stranded beta helix superfamily)